MAHSESKSSGHSAPWWLLLATLLGSAFMVQRASHAPDEKEASAANGSHGGSKAEVSSAEDRMLAPLREFLGIPTVSAGPSAPRKLELQSTLPSGSLIRGSVEWTDEKSSGQHESAH